MSNNDAFPSHDPGGRLLINRLRLLALKCFISNLENASLFVI